MLGLNEGLTEAEGDQDGDKLGLGLGEIDGLGEGDSDGLGDGDTEGEGLTLGDSDGLGDGLIEGLREPVEGFKATQKACLSPELELAVASMFPVEPEPDQT